MKGQNEFVECCTFPHGGPKSVMALLTTMAGFVVAMFGILFSCCYVTVDFGEQQAMINSTLPIHEDGLMGLGLFYYNDRSMEEHESEELCHICQTWTEQAKDELFDGAWKTARAFGALALSCMGMGMVVLLALPCTRLDKTNLRIVAALLVLGAFFALLTFVAFASSICDTYQCKYSKNATMAITASVLSLLSALLVFTLEPGTSSDDDDSKNDAEEGRSTTAAVAPITLTEAVLPGGAIKTMQQTVNADGTQTIQEIIREPAPIVTAEVIMD